MSKPISRNRMTYVAFLLGINIGLHKRVPMAELKKMCERMGCENVRTLLASGNVVFDAPKHSAAALAGKLEAELKKTFGFEIGVIARTIADVRKMIDADPFRKIKATKDTHRYVTFFTEKPNAEINPSVSISDGKGGEFHILAIFDNAVFSVVERGASHTTDMMAVLCKLLGKKITTRNWNTIEKMIV